MSSKQTNNMRKRQKIQQSNKTMFIMVAVASAAVGLCLVVSWLIFQQLVFSQEVVSEKSKTLDSLRESNKNIEVLSDNIRVLETNKNLNTVKVNESDKALQVILDSLPADANGLALGASIQDKLAKGINGVSIDSLSVDGDTASTSSGSKSSDELQSLTMRLVVLSNNANSLQQLLEKFEKSIRVISIDSLSLERSESRYTLSIEAKAHYKPAKIVELGEKVVKP